MQLTADISITVRTPNNPLVLYRCLTDEACSVSDHFDLVDYDVTVDRGGDEE